MARAIGWADFVPQETLFWRRRVWDKVGLARQLLRLRVRLGLDLARAQRAGFRFKRLPRFLGAFRVHELQKTSAMSSIGFAEMQRRIRRIHFGRDVTATEIDRGLRNYRALHVVLHRAYKLKLLQILTTIGAVKPPPTAIVQRPDPLGGRCAGRRADGAAASPS